MTQYFKIISIIIFSFLLFSCGSSIKDFNLNDDNYFSCSYGSKVRHGLLYLPEKNLQRMEDCPLVVMLHGYSGSALSFMRHTGFEKDALPRRYAVLYIDGIRDDNVTGSSTGFSYNYNKHGKADIDFITELSLYIQKEYGLNKKLYAVGFSNGAFMANKLAVEKSDCFNGIVSVGGMMPDSVWENRNKTRNEKKSISILQINGTDDEVVPMYLNNSAKNNPHPAMEDVLLFFAEKNGLSGSSQEAAINDVVKISRYGNKVWWVLIDGYRHNWPSERYCKININSLILDFLDAQ